MFWLYNFLITILSPFWVPWMILRARRRGSPVNWQERQGNIASKLTRDRPRLWLHAVSVGEVIAALPILRELRMLKPELQILVSVTTSSGHEVATEKLEKAQLVDQVCYFPIDIFRFSLIGLTRIRPQVVAIMETELWMNFLTASKIVEAKVLLINGRISDRSLNRARWVQFFYESMLRKVDRCLMQSDADAERIRFLGANQAEVMGNTKFDEQDVSRQKSRQEARHELGIPQDAKVVVVGSTRGMLEHQFVARSMCALKEDVWIVHAPRHLEECDEFATYARELGLDVKRRSKQESGRYLILDTYGELGWVYAAADVAVIGGGFEKNGGQNLIQPLALGIPVIRGEHFQNFKQVAELAEQAGATMTSRTEEELTATVGNLLENPEKRRQMGKSAEDLVRQQRGASRRYAEAIIDALGQ